MEKTALHIFVFIVVVSTALVFSGTFPLVFYRDYKLAGIIFTPYPHRNFFYHDTFSFSKAPLTILWQTDSFCRFCDATIPQILLYWCIVFARSYITVYIC